MPQWLVNIGNSTWEAAFMAAPWILLGLLVAGLLYVYLPANLIRRAMGGNSFWAIIRAALVGAPLPLCSCGVIPTALYLRKEGAGRGPVLSFLISTPETNVDSVALTYAMMGPLMAIARPVAAIASAISAGLGEKFFGAPDPHAESSDSCGCKLCDARAGDRKKEDRGGLLGALNYAGVVLMRDLAPWLVIGLVLAGIIGGLVPKGFFQNNNLSSGILPMLLMALVATPMYMCTTASTPVAAFLVAKGISPGAALVFLLVGPATNIATMTTVGRFLGKRSLIIYLASIVGVSLLLGLGLDAVAGQRITASVAELSAKHHHTAPWITALMWSSVVVFLLLVANGLRLRLVPYWLAWRSKTDPECAETPAAGAAAADPCCASAKAPADPCCASASCGSNPEGHHSEQSDADSDKNGPESGGNTPGGDSCPHCHSG